MNKDCVSLEIAQKLQKAGYKSECERAYCGGHTWYNEHQDGEFQECAEKEALLGEDHYCESASLVSENLIPAPTATELAEELPRYINNPEYEPKNIKFPIGKFELYIYPSCNGDLKEWFCHYVFKMKAINLAEFPEVQPAPMDICFYSKFLADSLGLCFVYLLENGLITKK